MEEETVN